jgi:dienelactone hydrolase
VTASSRASVHQRGRTFARVTDWTVDVALFRAGAAIIALHIVDDNFFQPPRGVSAADHLFSGLVPLAALIAAAVAYPRLRPGWRATLALLLGAFGIAMSSEAFYYARNGVLSGDDYTGLAALAGGLLLIGVGVTTLWRSRRLDASLWRYSRRLLLGIAAAVVFFFVVFPFSLSYGFTHAARPVTSSGHLGAPYRSVAFHTSDGLELKGWFVPAKNGATVIVYPGKKGTQEHARMLVRHGYGVLVFDRRGEGASEGDPNALGWGFDRDLLGAIAFLRGRRDVDANRIGGLGLSVGGEALLQTAAETGRLKAVVSDGAGSRSVREDSVHMSLKKVPEIAFSGVMTAGMALFSNRLPPPNLKHLAREIAPTTAVFLIHATRGASGEDNNPAYYRALRGPKQIWEVETSHTHGLSARPREYERRVIGFFDRTLRAR